MHTRFARRLVALTAVAASTAGVSACGRQEPLPEASDLSQAQVRIAVDPDSPQQLVLGEIYIQTLGEEGRSASLVHEQTPDSGSGVDVLEEGTSNFLVACTGNALAGFDMPTAKRLEKEREEAGDETDRDFLAETHIAMMSALPTVLTTVDPSSAPGCKDHEKVDLPQNFVPIYAKDLLDRDERFAIASVTKYLTTEDLDDLVEEADRTGSVSQTVEHWINTSTSNPENTSGSSDGSGTSDGGAGGDAGANAGAGSGSGDTGGSTLK